MLGVVVVPPVFNRELRLRHRNKPMRVQTLIAQAAVEAFYKRVLRWLPRLDEGQRDAASIRPGIEHPTRKLRPVVHHNRGRESTAARELGEDFGDTTPRERAVHLDRQTLPREVIDDREAAKPAIRGQAIV